MLTSDRPRILINRLSALGDCVLTLPVLCALRKHYPKAEIAWVTQPLQAEVLQGHPDLDHLIVVEKGWLKSPRQLLQTRKQLRSHRFDLSIDVQGLTKSGMASWLSGAKRRISFTRGQARELAPTFANCWVEPTREYIASKYLELLKPLGIETEQLEYRLPEDYEAAEVVAAWLEQSEIGIDYCVINPGAGWFSKTWSTKRFAEVARHLHACHAMQSVVTWGSEQEKAWAEEIAQQSGGAAVVCNRFSIGQLKELIRHASLFVGNDTGPLHFAVALDTPTVSLFGVTKAEYYSPCNAMHRTVQAEYQPLSSRDRRKAGNQAMLKNRVSMVVEQIDELFDQKATTLKEAA
ncbi:MAG: glycosyltransferase family 9 protein [Pirellulales bacterium]